MASVSTTHSTLTQIAEELTGDGWERIREVPAALKGHEVQAYFSPCTRCYWTGLNLAVFHKALANRATYRSVAWCARCGTAEELASDKKRSA